jgi:hypothetical protein
VNENEIMPFNIYPNPANESFTIQSDYTAGKEYFLFDISGRILKSGILQNRTEISITELSKGFYHLKIQDQIKTFKIIKN